MKLIVSAGDVSSPRICLKFAKSAQDLYLIWLEGTMSLPFPVAISVCSRIERYAGLSIAAIALASHSYLSAQ